MTEVSSVGDFLDMVHEVGLGCFKNNVALIEWCLRRGKCLWGSFVWKKNPV